jgi:hypothetical protein
LNLSYSFSNCRTTTNSALGPLRTTTEPLPKLKLFF